MPPNPPNIWRRPLRGPAGIIAGCVLLVIAAFVVFAIGFFVLMDVKGSELIRLSAIYSLLLVLVVVGGFILVRWIRNPGNLRRFILAMGCVITLIALAYAEENWRGWHAWEGYRRQLAAKGENLDFSAVVPPSVPDARNLACTPLFQRIFDFTQGQEGTIWHDTNAQARAAAISATLRSPSSTNIWDSAGDLMEAGELGNLPAWAAFYQGNTNYPQAPPGAPPAQVIITALAKFAPEMDELRQAAATRPETRFPIQYDYQPPWAILLPHLSLVRSLTIILQIQATAQLEERHAETAFEDLKLGLRLSDGIREEPFLIDHLVRLATLRTDLQIVREALARHAWTDEQLAMIETRLGPMNLLAEYEHAMRGERDFHLSGVNFFRRQGFHARPSEVFDMSSGGSAPDFLWDLMPGGWYYQNMVSIARLHEEFTLPAADPAQHRVFPDIIRKGEHVFEMLPVAPYTALARRLMPAFDKAIAKSARMQTYVDAARLACALERYRLTTGALPQNLDALVPRFILSVPNDVIDGKPLRYRLNPDGSYVLYSIGWNQKDDGGQLAWTSERKKQVNLTGGDWVWFSGKELLSAPMR